MNRRSLLGVLATLPFVRSATAAGPVPPGSTSPQVEELRAGWKQHLAKNADIATDPAPLVLSKDEWRKRLSPEAFHVLREEGTERPGSSPHNAEKRRGVFVCAPIDETLMMWPKPRSRIPGRKPRISFSAPK